MSEKLQPTVQHLTRNPELMADLQRRAAGFTNNPGTRISRYCFLYQPEGMASLETHLSLLAQYARLVGGNETSEVFGNQLQNGGGLIYWTVQADNDVRSAISIVNLNLPPGITSLPELPGHTDKPPHEL